MDQFCFLNVGLRTIFLAMTLLVAPRGWAQLAPSQVPANKPATEPAPLVPDLSTSDRVPKLTEDFSTPALTAGTVLRSLDALQLESDEFPTFTREIQRVQWRSADPIDLYVIKPARIKKPPVILYLHDYPTENDLYRDNEFCRLLTKEGFAAVGFVPALTGQRYHDVPMKQWFVSELKFSLSTSAHDVQMVINYLATRGDIDMNRVGIFGAGSGASIAILAAAVDPRIKTLDLVDPWGDWPDWIAKSPRIPENERADYLKPEWLAEVAPLDPVKWLPQLEMRKVRIQFVNDADINPATAQEKIEAAVPANAAKIHYNNTAAYRAAVAGGAGFAWVKENMPAGKSQSYRASARTQAKGTSTTVKDSQR